MSLLFDHATHTYRKDGIVVPSVTQILKPVAPDFSMVDPAVLAAAADLGRRIHKVIEMHERAADLWIDDELLTEDVLPYFAQYLSFKHQTGFICDEPEAMRYSDRWRFAGTMDLIGRINGVQWLIDVKTGSEVPRYTGPQTAAYAELIGNRFINRASLHLQPDKYRFTPLTDSGDWGVFLSCLTIHRFNEKQS